MEHSQIRNIKRKLAYGAFNDDAYDLDFRLGESAIVNEKSSPKFSDRKSSDRLRFTVLLDKLNKTAGKRGLLRVFAHKSSSDRNIQP